MDHLKNLKQYIEDDITYSRYKENPDIYYDNYEKMMIAHCEDLKWVIDELEALYELVAEMKNENIKSRKD